VQVANGWSRGTSEVLVIGLHMVGRIEYGCVIKALENLWSKKKRGASLFFSLFYFLLIFLFFFFSLYSSYFSYFSFLLIIFFSFFIFFLFFFFAPQNFLQHITYIAFVSENDSSPMLEWCSSSCIKERGNACSSKYKFHNVAGYLNLHREFYSILKLGCGQGGDHRKMFLV
jgi:hypothetical protein